MGRWAAIVLLLLLNVQKGWSASAPATDTGSRAPESEMQPRLLVPDLISLNNIIYSLAAQIFPTNINDTFLAATIPSQGLPNLATSPTSYRFKLCERAAVKDCVAYGRPGSAAPERIQGIWWTDGLDDPTLALSLGGGEYDAQSRVLSISTFSDSLWGLEATSSTWQGSFWSVSGAAIGRLAELGQLVYQIHFNEDFTFGQIVPTRAYVGLRLAVPPLINSLTMEWMGQDSWRRWSSALTFFDVRGGNYVMRKIINGDGSNGSWFDKGWLTYKGGVSVAVLVPA